MKDSTERYSFRVHRRQAWSLEHIHAQHSESSHEGGTMEGMAAASPRRARGPSRGGRSSRRSNSSAELTTWATKSIGECSRTSRATSTAAFTLADGSAAAAPHSVHSLSNLALVASGHNSALNNAVFEVKRRRILELDRQGAYIPICTRQVFLKYYTAPTRSRSISGAPRTAKRILNAILSSDGGVGAYLKPEVPLSS